MPFQVLTGQWSKIFTHKFRVFYTDLIRGSNSWYYVKLFDAARTVEVIGAKVWLRETFIAGAVTTCKGYVTNDIRLDASNVQQRSFCNFNAFQPVNDYSGSLKMSQPFIDGLVSPTGNSVNRQSAPTGIYISFIRTNAAGDPPFTAGYLDVWVMTMKMP